MGLFSSRPEDPTEWGGLPAEPYKAAPQSQLDEAGQVDPSAVALGDSDATTSLTVTFDIPMPDPTAPADGSTD